MSGEVKKLKDDATENESRNYRLNPKLTDAQNETKSAVQSMESAPQQQLAAIQDSIKVYHDSVANIAQYIEGITAGETTALSDEP